MSGEGLNVLVYFPSPVRFGICLTSKIMGRRGVSGDGSDIKETCFFLSTNIRI